MAAEDDDRATVSLARAEHVAWMVLCAALRESGAVTMADLRTPIGRGGDTIGLRILNAAREWGQTKEAIGEWASPADERGPRPGA